MGEWVTFRADSFPEVSAAAAAGPASSAQEMPDLFLSALCSFPLRSREEGGLTRESGLNRVLQRRRARSFFLASVLCPALA